MENYWVIKERTNDAQHGQISKACVKWKTRKNAYSMIPFVGIAKPGNTNLNR